MRPATIVLIVAAVLGAAGVITSALSLGEVASPSGPMTVLSWPLILLGLVMLAIGMTLKARERRTSS